MAKIHKDKHGLYVKCDGQVFRPQVNTHYYPVKINGLPWAEEKLSKYEEGQAVKARHPAEVNWAYVGDEYWYSHGYYMKWCPEKGSYTVPSEELWMG